MGPIDSLDHSSRLLNYGSKMGIDATRKWATEGFTREWPEVLKMPDDVKNRVSEMWKKLGLR
jgi:4-hydroxy-3-polyprenylbenzoate decarboxylase